MTKKKLVKKLILTVSLLHLSELKLRQKIWAIIKAAIANPTMVSGLNPTTAAMNTKATTLDGLYATRDSLRQQQKTNTEQIIETQNDLVNSITSLWMPQVQQAIGGDATKAKTLGYGIKSEDTGHTDNVVGKAADSHPMVNHIDINIHLQHTLHIINSISGHAKLPADANQIDIYEQLDGTAPTTIKGMQYLGIAKKGKFINHFDSTDLGKTVHYIVVYIDKKTLKPLEMSPVVSTVVN